MNTITCLAAVAAFSFGDVQLECKDPGIWKIDVVREVEKDGSEVAKVVFDAPEEAVPPRAKLIATLPQVDATDVWTINTSDCGIPPNWKGWDNYGSCTIGMPLQVAFNGHDQAVFSIASSECIRQTDVLVGVREEGSLLEASVTFFTVPEAPLRHYEAKVRLNAKARPFADAVREEVSWIEKVGGFVPCRVPDAALEPLYSSWYNFHQDVFAKDIEEECAIAAKLGMKTIILDDGWQTDDTNRGYAFCGDWQVSTRRFPDFAAHVKKVQSMGMKYMMWYSVPFIGLKSANYEKFRGKYLIEKGGDGAAVLDPRFPEVRKFLVDLYVKAMKDWDIDGFKLDFIDSFRFEGEDPAVKENYAGRDEKSVPVAVNRLMTEVKSALSAIKPDVLIEFRQRYDGPAIRQYGNMMRVGDCPGNMRRNRFAIANLRLASGATAVHSDMIEWNFNEDPAKSALFIINSIFGVVQYSVMLRNAPENHRAMIEKWIRFSKDHRDTLLKGKFTPHHPELQYPWIEAEGDAERIIGVYCDNLMIPVPKDGKRLFVMNASGTDKITIRRDNKVIDVFCPSGDYTEIPE